MFTAIRLSWRRHVSAVVLFPRISRKQVFEWFRTNDAATSAAAMGSSGRGEGGRCLRGGVGARARLLRPAAALCPLSLRPVRTLPDAQGRIGIAGRTRPHPPAYCPHAPLHLPLPVTTLSLAFILSAGPRGCLAAAEAADGRGVGCAGEGEERVA